MSGPERAAEDALGAVRYWGIDPALDFRRESLQQVNRLYRAYVDDIGLNVNKVWIDELAKEARVSTGNVPDLKIRKFDFDVPSPRLTDDDLKVVMQRAMREVGRANRETEPQYRARRRRRLLLLV